AFIGLKECCPCFFVGVGFLLHFRLLCFLNLRSHFHHHLPGFLFREQRLGSGDGVFHSAGHNIGVHLDRLFMHVCAKAHAESVTEFFLLRGKRQRMSLRCRRVMRGGRGFRFRGLAFGRRGRSRRCLRLGTIGSREHPKRQQGDRDEKFL